MQIEQNLFRVVAGESGCRLVNNIAPVEVEVEVKGEGTVHFALDIRPRRCYSGILSAK